MQSQAPFFLALTNYLGNKVLGGCNSFISLGKQLVTFIIHALLTLLFSRLLAGTPRGRELFGLRRLTTKLLQANARFRVPSQTRRYFLHCSEQKKDGFYKKKLHHRQNNNIDGNEVGEVLILPRFLEHPSPVGGASQAIWTASTKLFSRESVLWLQASFSYRYRTLSPRTSCQHVIRSGYLRLVLFSTCRFRCW